MDRNVSNGRAVWRLERDPTNLAPAAVKPVQPDLGPAGLP